jgi:hypothetical protein
MATHETPGPKKTNIAEAVGRPTINCHVHAKPDVEDLFPRSRGTNGSQAVRAS